MRQVSVTAARSQFGALVEAAAAGEDIILTRRGKPIVKLVRVGRFRIGLLDGQLGEAPDFLKPLSDEELALWERGPEERS